MTMVAARVSVGRSEARAVSALPWLLLGTYWTGSRGAVGDEHFVERDHGTTLWLGFFVFATVLFTVLSSGLLVFLIPLPFVMPIRRHDYPGVLPILAAAPLGPIVMGAALWLGVAALLQFDKWASQFM